MPGHTPAIWNTRDWLQMRCKFAGLDTLSRDGRADPDAFASPITKRCWAGDVSRWEFYLCIRLIAASLRGSCPDIRAPSSSCNRVNGVPSFVMLGSVE